ncbi:unannotated protein [freshwater metagenome]|uniref:Unannotated protein n=1 Tax=freshwater metagenome TaxID=449393 RepID=A0A6J7SF68_9ZZZZ
MITATVADDREVVGSANDDQAPPLTMDQARRLVALLNLGLTR